MGEIEDALPATATCWEAFPLDSNRKNGTETTLFRKIYSGRALQTACQTTMSKWYF